MKNKTNLIGIIVIMALIVFVIVACDNGTKPCSHDWSSWVETTPASITEELVEVNGEEERTCSKCGTEQTRPITFQSYFYGTWYYNEDEKVIISANTLEYFYYDGELSEVVLAYKMENLTWEPRANGDIDGSLTAGYTVGYTIKGTLTAYYDFWPYKEDGEEADIGDIVIDYWYIHTDKQSIDWGDWGNENDGINYPYVKQP